MLRPIIKEGIRSVILFSPPKQRYSDEFLDHVTKHHPWLIKGANQIAFSNIVGNQAKNQKDLYYLKTQEYFNNIVNETSNRDGMLILEELTEIVNKNKKFSKILYTWKEIDY
ncbi:MAG: hypothetical protein JW891_00860 [Candidatus Lokiarchaeota archaeon]|nr:hypothetical protein [Candidatus Lokiarchaeota archaeon]